jgi:hypothetical protein
MNDSQEKRREERLRYHWPIWFGEDFAGDLTQGQMADVSSGGAAFTYYSDGPHLFPGQRVTARFSVPRYGPEDSFDMVDFVRSGSVCRVEAVNQTLRRAAICFAEPLPFRPGEQVEEETPLAAGRL